MQCSAAQRSAVSGHILLRVPAMLDKNNGPPLTLPELPIRQILANVVPVFRHTGSQLATEDHKKCVCRIRACSTYALTKLDYITHGAVLPAPSLTNLQVITNRNFGCVYRLSKWAPSKLPNGLPTSATKLQFKRTTQHAHTTSIRGRFCTARTQRAHSARTAPTFTVHIRITAPKTTYPRNHAQPIQISKIQNLMLAMGPRDLNSAPYSPLHLSSHSMTSFPSSKLTDLPVVF